MKLTSSGLFWFHALCTAVCVITSVYCQVCIEIVSFHMDTQGLDMSCVKMMCQSIACGWLIFSAFYILACLCCTLCLHEHYPGMVTNLSFVAVFIDKIYDPWLCIVIIKENLTPKFGYCSYSICYECFHTPQFVLNFVKTPQFHFIYKLVLVSRNRLPWHKIKYHYRYFILVKIIKSECV